MGKGDLYTSKEWIALRKQILDRDGHRCMKCGDNRGLEVHHIQPRYEDGGNEPQNLITLCNWCHRDWHVVEDGVAFLDWIEVQLSALQLFQLAHYLLHAPEGFDIDKAVRAIYSDRAYAHWRSPEAFQEHMRHVKEHMQVPE